MITSKQRTLIGLAAVIAIASIQACSSTDAPDLTPTAGAAGTRPATAGTANGGSAPAAGGSAAAGTPALGGGGAGGAGGAAAGAASAGAPAAGAGAGGGPVGTGGGSAGSATGGGHSGGSAGGSTTGGGGAAATATFAEVKTIFGSSCSNSTNKCHDAASGHSNFSGDLYAALTTPLPATGMYQMCKGTTLVTPSNAADSFLVKLITGPGQSTCKDSGKDTKIDRMPNKCGQASPAPACLTAAQIKTISDWIAAGAKQ